MGKSGNPAVRAAQETAAPVEYDPTPVDENGVEDFDAFWSTQEQKNIQVRIRGQLFELPPALPLQFELEAQKVNRSKDDKDVRKLVALLFGKDGLKRLAAAGVDSAQFKVLLAWAPQRIGGGNMSLAEVAAKIAEAEAAEDDADPT